MATPALTATETTRTGTLTNAILKVPTQSESNTGSKETIIITTTPSTTVSATVNTSGDLTIAATLNYEVHITSPVTAACKTATPVHVVLSSAAPYTTTSKSVTVKDVAITIPDFTGCIASSELDTTFSGAGGELGLTLHGTLFLPPPGTLTTVSLSATPASPQVHGSSVTIKATVKKATGTLATTAKGLVTFYDGTTELGTASASGGTASYTTSTLPVGTDTLAAVYGGGSGYKGSTSSPFAYVIAAAPSVSVTGLPASVTGGTATERSFTVTVTNPGRGLNWTKLYVKVALTGIPDLGKAEAPLQYENTSLAWCTPIDLSGVDPLDGYVAGVGACPGTYPASFSLAAGSALTIPFRVSYPTTGYYGVQKVTATLYTGTCTSATRCTATTPLSGTVAPTGSATVEVLPPSPLGSRITDLANHKATSTVHKTFDVALLSTVGANVATTLGKPAPTGAVTYAIDGTTVATSELNASTGFESSTTTAYYNTADLALGKHQLVSTYTPQSYTGRFFYGGSSLTETFTVITVPTGTPFTCVISGLNAATVPAYVTATGTVPAATLATTTRTVPVTNISVTLDVDPADDAIYYNGTQTAALLGFSPSGTAGTSGPITFTGVTNTLPDVTGTWTNVSTEIPIMGGTPPGTKLTVGADSIVFEGGFSAWTCKPAVAPATAPVASTEVAGTTLAVTPTSTTVGSPVTLTATIYPTPTSTSPASTVNFSANGNTLGTVIVNDTGPTAGKAKLVETGLTAGHYTVVAKWSGNGTPTVPANASKAVELSLRAPGGGVPVAGNFVCTVGLPSKITLGGSIYDSRAAPATLHDGQTYTAVPHLTFTVTGSLLKLAGENKLYTIVVGGSKLTMALSGFTSTPTTPDVAQQTGTYTVHLTPNTTFTPTGPGGPTSATVPMDFKSLEVTMTAATGVTATITPGNLKTSILVTVKCHPTNYAHPVPFGAIDTIKSSGVVPLTITPPSATSLPSGQAGVVYNAGQTYWTATGGHGTNVWTETGPLDGLTFHGTGAHASLTGIPTVPGTFSFSVTVTTKTDPVTHTYSLHIATAPATPIVVQPFKLTVTPGTLTLTCTTATGATKPNVAQDVTSQATAKPCTLITLGNIKLNEKRHVVPSVGHNLIISTARGGAHDSWALYAVMVPTSTVLTGNTECNNVQGFCNKTTTNPTSFPSHINNTTITPNYLGVTSKCTTNSTAATTFYNDNPEPTVTSGIAPGVTGLSVQTKLCSAATGSSGGQFFVTTLDFSLIVPPNVYAGTYYGTVLYTLSSTATVVPPNPITPPQ